jgi:hypothetical protein
MAKRTLDRHSPYGEIYGAAGARYEQHGIQFDGDGVELPGFENVVIPDQKTIIIVDDANLRGEVDRLAALCNKQRAELEEKDAAHEEVQGQLDTARIQIGRLQDELAQTKALLPAETAAVVAAETAGVNIDAQLDLQTGGAPAGKKAGK